MASSGISIDYKVVEDVDRGRFEKKCVDMLSDGYEALGGASRAPNYIQAFERTGYNGGGTRRRRNKRRSTQKRK